jgi:S-methylmethionine-dependent homocysteine/selenocysteine methylase
MYLFVFADDLPLVVGSVGPYGAHLHDGSEYDGSYADTTNIQVSNSHVLSTARQAIQNCKISPIDCQSYSNLCFRAKTIKHRFD